MCICRIIFLTGASNHHNDSFLFLLSLFSFCALHCFRRAWSALSCCPPWFLPFPPPSFFPALSILSALGGIGWPGCVSLQGGGRGGGGGGGAGVGSSLPAPSFPLRRGILAQGGSLLGGGANRSQSALHMHVLVCICSNVRRFHETIGMIEMCYHTNHCACWPCFVNTKHESAYMLQDRERHRNDTVFHLSHLACAGTPWPSNLD